MDVSDNSLWYNRDWDPEYLASIFQGDFYDLDDLWVTNITDMELLEAGNNSGIYFPVVEDISIDDLELCQAVETIEEG